MPGTLTYRQSLPVLRAALREDRTGRDITSRLLYPVSARLTARLVARDAGVVCGADVARWTFQLVDRRVHVRVLQPDGASVSRGAVIAVVDGPARSVLSAERTAVNLVSRLSGVATLTRHYVEAVRRTGVRIFDTRKTTPGLRILERYAVRCGGGVNHRFDLQSQILIKSNHLRGLSTVTTASELTRLLRETRRRGPRGCRIEVEVWEERLVLAALAGRPDIIMLDNLPLAAVKRVMQSLKRVSQRPSIEVSGGITLRNVRAFAETGADRIAIGALTRSARWLDIALEVGRPSRRGTA